MRETEETLAILNDLHCAGVQIALDDVGTGYSSLSYLRRLPFDCIKIDRLFLRDVDRSTEAAAIVSMITQLAGRLSAKTVAEGVETKAQLDRVCSLGCTFAQGYYFARPVPVEEARHAIAADAHCARTRASGDRGGLVGQLCPPGGRAAGQQASILPPAGFQRPRSSARTSV